MEALDLEYSLGEAIVRAFTSAVSDRSKGQEIDALPLALVREAVATGSLHDTPIIRQLSAAGRVTRARYFVHSTGVTFVVHWPCGTLKRYDVELAY
jgi:hypothetical protein